MKNIHSKNQIDILIRCREMRKNVKCHKNNLPRFHPFICGISKKAEISF